MNAPIPKTIKLEGVDAARRWVDLIAASPSEKMSWRLIRQAPPKSAQNLDGTLDDLTPQISAANEEGFGVFAVVNEGGQNTDAIKVVRAVFIDSDGVSLEATAKRWHMPPHFIVWRNDSNWHAYWLVTGAPLDRFTEVQSRLAAYYDTDATVTDLPRVMRVPGFAHTKNPANPQPVMLFDLTGGAERWACAFSSIEDVTAGLPELPTEAVAGPSPASSSKGDPISEALFREVLSWIDPTLPGDQNSWAGMAKAIRHGQLPLLRRDEIDWEELLDDWCSGSLWRARTGDSRFEVPTYQGRDELLARTRDKPRDGGNLIGAGSFIRLARANGYDGQAASFMDAFDDLHGGDEDIAESEPLSSPNAQRGKPNRFALRFEEDWATRPLPKWIVENLIEEKSLNLHFGTDQTFKTFTALEIACGLAAGVPIFATAEGDEGFTPLSAMPVVYICGEGVEYVEKVRIAAWKKARGIPKIPKLATIEHMPSLQPGEDLETLISAIESQRERLGGNPALIIVDTLARALKGLNENDTKDAGLFVEALDTLRDRFGAALWVVHHTNREGEVRGNSRLTKDFGGRFLQKRKPDTTLVYLENEKQKNRKAIDAEIALKGQDVFVGVDGTMESALVFDRVPSMVVDAANKSISQRPSDDEQAKSKFIHDVREALFEATDGGKKRVPTSQVARVVVHRRLNSNPDQSLDGREFENAVEAMRRKLQRNAKPDKKTRAKGLLADFIWLEPESGTRDSDLRWTWKRI